jgi:hypothetical protein
MPDADCGRCHREERLEPDLGRAARSVRALISGLSSAMLGTCASIPRLSSPETVSWFLGPGCGQ